MFKGEGERPQSLSLEAINSGKSRWMDRIRLGKLQKGEGNQ